MSTSGHRNGVARLEDGSYLTHIHTNGPPLVVVFELEQHTRVCVPAEEDGSAGEDTFRVVLDKMVSDPERGAFIKRAMVEMARAEGMLTPEDEEELGR